MQGLSFSAAEDSAFELGQAAAVLINGRIAGKIGRPFADEVLAKFDIKKAAVYFAEVDIEIASDTYGCPHAKFTAIEEFPAMTRDVSLAVKGFVFYPFQISFH